ncbi:PspC domain-containing protein, partial [Micromonospora sonneratiae]
MTDEAAVPRRPATGDDIGPAQPDPVPSAPAPGSPPEGFPDDETTSVFEPREASGPPPTSGPPPGPGSPPPPGYGPPPPNPTAFTSRYGFVRPKDGRYLAGVCAAIGRATNTDPILWRVLLAVLGFFGGIGILIYVAAWLIIPGEGDTASPVESMLGRGRSSMSPTTVLVLAITVAVIFGFIVTDGFRAILLGAAILIGGALLLNRNAIRGQVPNAGAPTPSGGPGPAYAPTAAGAPMPTGAPTPFGMAQMGHPGLPPQPGTGPVHPGQPHSGAGYPPPVPPTGPYPPMVSPPVSSGYPAGGQPSVPYPAAPVPSSPGAPPQPLP